MKAISVRQPWAWAIIHHGKDIENRTWKTNFRGRVLIHAGNAFDKDAPADMFAFLPAGVRRDEITGGIIGSVEIVDCVEHSDSPWFTGPYGFVLKNPQPLPFHRMPGKLGLFEVKFGLMESAGF